LEIDGLGSVIGEEEGHLQAIGPGTDFVQDNEVGSNDRSEPEFRGVGGGVEESGLVGDAGEGPIAVMPTGSTEGFEIKDVEGTAGKAGVAKGEQVVGPGKGGLGSGAEREGEQEDQGEETGVISPG
jgi:hypothetical protein